MVAARIPARIQPATMAGSPGDGYPLLLSAGEVLHRLVDLVRKAHPVQQGVRLGDALLSEKAADRREERHVRQTGVQHVLEQGTALPDAGNLLKLRQRFGVSVDWLLEDAQGWENLTDGAPTGSEGGGTAPSPKLRKSVLPWAIPLGVSGFGLLLLGIFSSVFPAEYMVASTVIAGNQEPADRIYRGLAGFLKCNNLEWLFRLCLVIAIGSLLAGLWQKGVMKRFEDAVDHKLDELGEKNRDASA